MVLGVTRRVCDPTTNPNADTCRRDIAASGGQLLPDEMGAVWLSNLT